MGNYLTDKQLQEIPNNVIIIIIDYFIIILFY